MTGERVRITSPHTVDRAHRPRRAAEEISEETPLGQIYMQSLIEYQLRIAGAVAFLIAVTLGGLPLLFLYTDWWMDIAFIGIPLPWIILGFAIYPFIIIIAWVYVRRVERAEADFVRIVDEP